MLDHRSLVTSITVCGGPRPPRLMVGRLVRATPAGWPLSMRTYPETAGTSMVDLSDTGIEQGSRLIPFAFMRALARHVELERGRPS